MATDLTMQQREDRKKAIQRVRDYYPQLKGSGDDFITNMVPGMVEFAECAIRAERERDEAVRLLKRARTRMAKLGGRTHDIDAFFAAHPANGGQDE